MYLVTTGRWNQILGTTGPFWEQLTEESNNFDIILYSTHSFFPSYSLNYLAE